MTRSMWNFSRLGAGHSKGSVHGGKPRGLRHLVWLVLFGCVALVLLGGWDSTEAQVIDNASSSVESTGVVVGSVLPTVSVEPTQSVEPTPTAKPRKKTWRQIARKVLKEEGVYTAEHYWMLKHCIIRESRGREKAKNGQYLGCLQFGRSWKGTRAQKMNYEWSMKRWVKVLKVQGKHGIYKHWCKWHGCGRVY